MFNLPPSSGAGVDSGALPANRALQFLKSYPAISRSLLLDCEHDISKVSTLVEPILDAPQRCATSYYIQALTTGRTAFLTTNLTGTKDAQITAIASTWLVGRSRNCAIMVPHPSVSRCHAVIAHSAAEGFYIMDVGSSNGTFSNRQRLPVLERQALKDGDVLAFSHLQVEFFVVSLKQGFVDWDDPTCAD